MTIYYADIGITGSGGDGSVGSPWQSDSFLAQVSVLTTSDSIRVKGVVTLPFTAFNVYTNLENWVDDPYRIYAGDFLVSLGSVVKNGVFRTSSFSVLYGSSIKNCLMSTSAFNIGLGAGGTALGCFIGHSGSFSGYPGTTGLLKDCRISASSYAGMANIVTDRCAFTGSLPAGTHTNYQINLPLPNTPYYTDPRSHFSSNILNIGVVYPPHPGNIPYTGYEVGFWNSPRTGIGAADFVPVWNDVTRGSLSFNAIAVGVNSSIMAVGYNGSIEMMSFGV